MSIEQLKTFADCFPISMEDLKSTEPIEFPSYDETQVNNF